MAQRRIGGGLVGQRSTGVGVSGGASGMAGPNSFQKTVSEADAQPATAHISLAEQNRRKY